MRLTLGEHVLDCTERTLIMGILNVATDSPVAHSIVPVAQARERARALREAGAAIIDVGAHSTRTHAREVPPEEEIARLCPVIEALRRDGMIVSVDTWTPAVARAAAAAGAHLLNDITGGSDPALVAVAVQYRLPIVVMHMRGRPKRHREADQRYPDIAVEVRSFLAERVAALRATGVPEVWVDPGFEFGKSMADNVAMLLALPNLVALGQPVLVSASRKGFLAELLGHGKDQQAPRLLEASIAFNVLAAYLGAHVVRVHDVAEVAAALCVVNEVRARQPRAAPED